MTQTDPTTFDVDSYRETIAALSAAIADGGERLSSIRDEDRSKLRAHIERSTQLLAEMLVVYRLLLH